MVKPATDTLRRMGRGALALSVAVGMVAIALLGSAGVDARQVRTCGPPDARTLTGGRRFRVYTVTRTENSGGNGHAVSLSFACLNPRGRPVLLGSTESGLAVYRRKHVGIVYTEPLSSRFPWVAFRSRSPA
jgi:hypothetical protein